MKDISYLVILPKLLLVCLIMSIAALTSKFNEIWVPDSKGSNNLSGVLSEHDHIVPPVNFIGPLSRFLNKCKSLDCLVTLPKTTTNTISLYCARLPNNENAIW